MLFLSMIIEQKTNDIFLIKHNFFIKTKKHIFGSFWPKYLHLNTVFTMVASSKSNLSSPKEIYTRARPSRGAVPLLLLLL